MGKIPPSFRSARLPVSTLYKSPQSQTLPQQQQQSPSQIPHKFPKKVTKKKTPKTLTTITPQNPKTPSLNSPLLSDAKTLFTSIAASSSAPLDLKFCNSILQSYTAISSLSDSISLLNHMIKIHPPFSPDRSTFHLILIQSCKSPDPTLSSVHKVLNLMQSHGYPPDKITADIAVRSLCSAGREDHAVEILKEVSLKHELPDTYTYNFVIKHLCKNRDLSSVNSFINQMRDSFNIKPDLVTYTIMIDNVCNKKNLREATRLLGLLSEEGFKPDCYLYNTIMKGHCMLSQGGEVLRVFKKMQEEGVNPDLVTYNTLIYGLSKSGRVKEARKFLSIMAEMGHFPDATTYTSLMNGMCREGNSLGALSLLTEMESKGCSPNSCTYNTLLHGLCKSRLVDKGIELYKLMKEGKMGIESGSYGTFIRALCRTGRVHEAYEVFDYAVESKSLSDVAAYSTLESTLKWLKKAKEQGLAV